MQRSVKFALCLLVPVLSSMMLPAAAAADVGTTSVPSTKAPQSTIQPLAGGGCRSAYNSGGWKNVYPCVSVAGSNLVGDGYISGYPSSCSYYRVHLADRNGNLTWAASPKMQCSARYSGNLATQNIFELPGHRGYAIFRAYNSKNQSILSLTSPLACYAAC